MSFIISIEIHYFFITFLNNETKTRSFMMKFNDHMETDNYFVSLERNGWIERGAVKSVLASYHKNVQVNKFGIDQSKYSYKKNNTSFVLNR